MSILDQVADRLPRISYRPTTIREFFVFRLAQKLGEPAAIQHYAELAQRHSDETLLLAYRQSLNNGNRPRDLARRFHEKLAKAGGQHNGQGSAGPLLGIKVERRYIAVAVFDGTTLDYHEVRHLSSHANKAEGTALSFLAWVLDNFNIESAGMEKMTNGDEIRRALLNDAMIRLLRESAIPLWEVRKRDLLEGYGHPPLKSRIELRQTARDILWPLLNGDRPGDQELDAAAVGLYVQTERVFLA